MLCAYIMNYCIFLHGLIKSCFVLIIGVNFTNNKIHANDEHDMGIQQKQR